MPVSHFDHLLAPYYQDKTIYNAYLEMTGHGFHIQKITPYSKSLCYKFTDPDGNELIICGEC